MMLLYPIDHLSGVPKDLIKSMVKFPGDETKVLVPYKDFEAILRHADNSTIREHVKHADESLAAAKNGELLERISHNRQQ